MNDNTKGVHVPRQGVDHLPGQLDLIEHAQEGAPPEKPFEDLGPNVTVLPVVTSHDLPVDRVLQEAHEAGLEMCVIVGYTKDGDEYFGSNVADGAEVVWCMERAKLKLLNMVRVGSSLEGFDGDGIPPTKA